MPALALLLALPLSFLTGCKALGDESHAVLVGETQRDYLEHIPAKLDIGKPAPLLLLFHGGGGSAKQAKNTYGFDRIADKHGVVIAFPNAIDGHWNDGRESEKFKEHDATIDDVAYAMKVISDMQRRHKIDATRIYAVGLSNGGMFVQRLAIEQTNSFAAVASIISSIPEPLKESFAPEVPLSVLFMNGTEDPIVPYAGGEVVLNLFPRLAREQPSRGHVLSTEESAALWAKRAGLTGEPTIKQLPDLKRRDDSTIEVHTWSDEESNHEVVLYRVLGGGHTLPGRKSRMPARVVGKTCRDINAQEAIWSFLAPKRRTVVNAAEGVSDQEREAR